MDLSLALKIISGVNLLPSANIVKITEIHYFSWFCVLTITCLLPFLTIVFVIGILRNNGVSSIFPNIEELIAFSYLILCTSFKKLDVNT